MRKKLPKVANEAMKLLFVEFGFDIKEQFTNIDNQILISFEALKRQLECRGFSVEYSTKDLSFKIAKGGQVCEFKQVSDYYLFADKLKG